VSITQTQPATESSEAEGVPEWSLLTVRDEIIALARGSIFDGVRFRYDGDPDVDPVKAATGIGNEDGVRAYTFTVVMMRPRDSLHFRLA
jgi:hypothetical protein